MKTFLKRVLDGFVIQCIIVMTNLLINGLINKGIVLEWNDVLNVFISFAGYIFGYVAISYFWEWLCCRRTAKKINRHSDSSDFKCVKVKKLN